MNRWSVKWELDPATTAPEIARLAALMPDEPASIIAILAAHKQRGFETRPPADDQIRRLKKDPAVLSIKLWNITKERWSLHWNRPEPEPSKHQTPITPIPPISPTMKHQATPAEESTHPCPSVSIRGSSSPQPESSSDSFSFRVFQSDDMARAALQPGALLGWEPGLGKTMPAFAMPWLWRSAKSLIVVQADLHDQLIKEGREKFGVNVRIIDSQETALRFMRQGILPFPGTTLPPLAGDAMPDYFITAYNWLGLLGGDEWEADKPTELQRNRRIAIAARIMGLAPDDSTLIAFTGTGSRDRLRSDTTPHELLGIPENATPREVKRAYFTAAKLYHPDLHPGDVTAEARFVLINAAYEKITGKDTRNYDTRLAELNEQPGTSAFVTSVQEMEAGIGTERHYEGGHTIRCVMAPTLASIIHSAFGCVACDEAVAIKSGTACAADGVLRMSPPNRLLLTGTPIKNKLPDIFFLMSWVTGFRRDPHARFPYGNTTDARASFAQDFGVCEENLTKAEKEREKGNYRRFTKTDPTRICNVHRLWRTFGPVVIRRRKDSLPDCDIVTKTIIPVHVMQGTRQQRTYKFHCDHPPAHDSLLASIGAQLTNLRMAACHPASPKLKRTGCEASVSTGIFTPKIAAVLKLATDLMTQGEQLVVASPSTDFSTDLSAILANAGIPHLTLDGRRTPTQRGKMIGDFKSGKIPVLIVGIKGMASGHNLDNCHNLVLPGLEWALDLNRQIVDRVHRLTSKKGVNIYVIISKGTIDERLASVWQEKGDASDLALDGRLIEEEKKQLDAAEFLRQAVADFDPTAATLCEDAVATQWQTTGTPEIQTALATYLRLRPQASSQESGVRDQEPERKNPKSNSSIRVHPCPSVVQPLPTSQYPISNIQSPMPKSPTTRTVFQILAAARAAKQAAADTAPIAPADTVVITPPATTRPLPFIKKKSPSIPACLR